MNKSMNIAVVGGGTAGFVSALIIKATFPKMKIDMIRSSKIGTIGVGEGSTEHWSKFMDYVGITAGKLIKECDSTFKAGIMFEDWTKDPYLQNVHDPVVADHMGFPMVLAKLIGEKVPVEEFVGTYLWKNETPFMKFIEEQPNETGVAQYHFNTQKLNDFLTDFSISKGINIIDDEITKVNVTDQNVIESIEGEKQTYNYDFYIDCTGFSRLLIKELGAEWQSYSKHLKMKEAIVFPTEYTNTIDPRGNEIPMWTLAKAMDAGWMFRIPVWNRKGNGYIFDSDFITAEQAQREVEAYLGHGIEVAKHIKFDPGALDKPWIGNVCATGLSASFVEPLEASSIGTTIQQTFLLVKRLINYNNQSIEKYNNEVNDITDNIRDFIALHYITPRRDTPFWKAVADTPLPESLKQNLEMWNTRIPIDDDIAPNALFNEYNFSIVMYALGLFNTDKILEQYNQIPPEAQEHAERRCQEKIDFDQIKSIPHKMMLGLLRSLV